jgi:hypothetical protein
MVKSYGRVVGRRIQPENTSRLVAANGGSGAYDYPLPRDQQTGPKSAGSRQESPRIPDLGPPEQNREGKNRHQLHRGFLSEKALLIPQRPLGLPFRPASV